jgi:hypothetical protein
MYKNHFTFTSAAPHAPRLPERRDAASTIHRLALRIRHLHLGYRRRERIAPAFIPAVLRAPRPRRGWRRQPLILESQPAPRRVHLAPRALHARRGGVLLLGRGRGRRGVGVVRRRCGRHRQEHHSNGVVLRARWRSDEWRFPHSLLLVGRAGATNHADRRHFSENGGGNGRGGGGDGREGWGLGRGSRTRVVVREMSRVALVRARVGDVSARRKVAPGKLRD